MALSLRIIVRSFVTSPIVLTRTVAPTLLRNYTNSCVTSNSKINGAKYLSNYNKFDWRNYSQQTTPVEDLTVDYEYMKKVSGNKNILIIDVREPEEVQEHGKIPNSINIPLANVTPVLSNVSDREFQEIYGREKPKKDAEVIFYCMSGKRAGKAQLNALNLGFKNVKNYVGSWLDWAAKTQ